MSGLNNLKTYITKIENVEKGRVKILIDYLLNKEHGNHSGKTEILNTIIDKKEFWVHNALKIKTNKLRRKGKGGSPLKVSNKSLTFNIPPDYHTTEYEAIKIQIGLFDYIKEKYALNGHIMKDIDFFTNIHFQNNTHINFIIPYLNTNGETMRFIKPEDFIKDLAAEFTKITDNVLGTNIKNYRTEAQQLEEEEIVFDAIDFENVTLKDIKKLKKKYKHNGLLTKVFSNIYRVMNTATEKSVKHLNKNIEKAVKGETLTLEEQEDLNNLLEGAGILKMLGVEQKKAWIKSMQKSGMQTIAPKIND